MKKYKVFLCGNYGKSIAVNDGQTVRTTNVTRGITDTVGADNTYKFDTSDIRKKFISNIFKIISLSAKSKNTVVFPAHNGVKIIVPVLAVFKRLFGYKLFYVVIGGWLPELLKKYKFLIPFIKRVDMLFVQTSTIKMSLSELGIENTVIFPNFKYQSFELADIKKEYSSPYRICFMSRVVKEKGIEELIETVKEINGEKTTYLLDIYGTIAPEYKEEFDELQKNFPKEIEYKGVAESSKTAEILSDYFIQIFPTKYKTEGHPGSILDSYNAGTPVLSARWNSWSDIIDEGETGITFEFENFRDMKEKMIDIAENPDIINSMRESCVEKAKEFKPENIIKILTDKLGE